MDGPTDAHLSEIRPDLWRWSARHPDWTPEEGGPDGWDPLVASLAWGSDQGVVLIDPLAPAEEPAATSFWRELDALVLSGGLPVAVVLTVFWHERSAAAVVARYGDAPGVTMWAPVGSVSRLDAPEARPFAAGELLPGGIVPYEVSRGSEMLLWLPARAALIAGDVLLGTGKGRLRLCPASWIIQGGGLAVLRRSLRPLVDLLPMDIVLPAHGDPVLGHGREALIAALATRRIRLTFSEVNATVELDASPAADAFWEALPLELSMSRWGDELYGATSLTMAPAADARDEMGVGEVAFWPDGSALCVFFGPTPASHGTEPRAISPVNPLGWLADDPARLRSVRGGRLVVERLG